MGTGGKYWIYGQHAVKAALLNPQRRIHTLAALKQLTDKFKHHKIAPAIRDKTFFEKKFGVDAVHQGVAAEVSPLDPLYLPEFLQTCADSSVVLVLDQVTDPHNIGAILRSAAAMNIDALVLPDRNAPSESAIMAKTASGALEIVPIIRETNLARTLTDLQEKNFWCYGFAEGGDAPIHKCKLDGRVALVMGAEGKGLRRLTMEHCDVLTHIPTADRFSTLNVANAAAIAMYEVMRQRG